ncbi:hypothetical protein HKD37_04G010511 [Glycine soja]|uniref:Uncharacterized protein n=1 Tax=Glycine soja TaxID=3848 RepID=A0A0B2Q5J1_GLYSO|nr:hypothetical protein JHK87_009976 [Glycine soja]KAG5049241.1 hypothetical protein JHK85_010344 [Glycine max]KHN15234.1 hypothetical protein glysoja_041068 [Glycine soja]
MGLKVPKSRHYPKRPLRLQAPHGHAGRLLVQVHRIRPRHLLKPLSSSLFSQSKAEGSGGSAESGSSDSVQVPAAEVGDGESGATQAEGRQRVQGREETKYVGED